MEAQEDRLTASGRGEAITDRLDGSENADREEEQGGNEAEGAFDDDAYKAEGKQDEPEHGV